MPNPSFEKTQGHPIYSGFEYIVDWFEPEFEPTSSPIYALSSDYYSTKSADNRYKLPNPTNKTISPHSGEAIMAFVITTEPILPPNTYREYASVKLMSPLVKGRKYSVEFWISNGDKPIVGYSSDRIGIHFSKNALQQPGNDVINVIPQLEVTGQIWNTGWQKVSFTLVADKWYEYLTIGNFYLDSETTMVKQKDANKKDATKEFAYYYFDDFSVVPLSNEPSLYVGQDQTICKNEVIKFDATTPNALKYKWNDNSINPKLEATEAGEYFVEVTLNTGEVLKDTVNLTVTPLPIVSLGADLTPEANSKITLDAGSGYSEYEWDNESKLQTVDVAADGDYWVEVTQNNCKNRDTVKVTFKVESVQKGCENLVPNGGFEKYSELPDFYGQSSRCLNWHNVSGTTGISASDYLNTNGTSFGKTPNYPNGNAVVPKSGNGVMGIMTYSESNADLRNYISVEFTEPMIVGNDYKVSFWHINPPRARKRPTGYQSGKSSNLGIRFSESPLSQTNNEPIITTPQIDLGEIWDTTWQQKTITFTADKAYKHITFGNFNDDANTLTTLHIVSRWAKKDAVFFFDDISIKKEDCGTTSTPNLNLGDDQTVCEGDSVIFDATTADAVSYKWNDGSSNPKFTTKIAGKYFVEIDLGGGTVLKDTVNVMVTALPTINLGVDLTPDANSKTTLDAGVGFTEYTWSDNSKSQTLEVTSDGEYWVEATQNGCKNRDTVVVTYKDAPTLTTLNLGTDQTICEGDSAIFDATTTDAVSYKWNDGINDAKLTAKTAGKYFVEVTLSSGDKLKDTVEVIVNDNSFESISKKFCLGQSFVVNNISRTSSGTYYDSLQTSLGCDSVIEYDLTFNPSSDEIIAVVKCTGDSLKVNNVWQKTAAVYSVNYTNAFGCDSTITYDLSFNSFQSTNSTKTICDNDSAFIHNVWRKQSGEYRDTLNSASGCDSISIVDLIVNKTYFIEVSPTICSGNSYFAQGTNQTTSGIYYDTLQTASGCDSVIKTTLSVNQSYNEMVSLTFKEGESYKVNGIQQTTTGTYTENYQTVDNCDSIINYDLLFTNAIVTQLNQTICEGESVIINGSSITNSGVYNDTLTTVSNEDSIIITTLVVNDLYDINNPQTICDGDSLFVRGSWQKTSGTFTDNLQSVSGCDSIVTTILTVLPPNNTTQNKEVCNGNSIIINGVSRNLSGIYKDTLTASNGCDSIVETKLMVVDLDSKTNSVSVCFGDSAFIAGQYRSQAGTFSEIFQNQKGCDSTITTTLNILSEIKLDLPTDTTICHFENLRIDLTDSAYYRIEIDNKLSIYDDIIFKKTGSYQIKVIESNGCIGISSINYHHKRCDEIIYVPSAFSPNNDGENDQLKIYLENSELITLKIYNRWGELLFETEDINESWDGYYNGNPSPLGNYLIYIEHKLPNHQSDFFRGTVVLFR